MALLIDKYICLYFLKTMLRHLAVSLPHGIMRNQRLADQVAAMQFRGRFYLLAAIACKEATDANVSSPLANVGSQLWLFAISCSSHFSW